MFPFSPRSMELQARVRDFMATHVIPAEPVYFAQQDALADCWDSPPVMEDLKARAKAEGLWNLFLPESHLGAGLTLPEQSPQGRAEIYDTMNRTLAALHRMDWRAVGLEGFGKATGYVPRQVARWTRAYEATKTHAIEAMDKVMPWLARNVPEGDEAAINHGDFRAENMVLHPTEPRVLGVLDWELATIGHPLPNLAYNCLPWNVPPDFPGIGGLVGLAPDHGIPSEADYVAAYCERTGRKGIGDWHYYVAFSLFRTAAILQGVHARALQGTASNENALAVGQLAQQAAGLACEATLRDGRP